MKTFAAAVIIVTTAAVVSAHHGKEGFEPTPITLRGVVTNSTWQNPHVVISLEVKKDNGTVERWNIDGSPPNAMRRGGFAEDALKAGTTLTVTGYPTADRTRLTVQTMTFPDGRTLKSGNEFFKPIGR